MGELFREVLHALAVSAKARVAVAAVAAVVVAGAAFSVALRLRAPAPGPDETVATATDEQERLAGSYGDLERGVLEELEGRVWSASDGSRVTFSGTSWTDEPEEGSGEPEEHAWAICACAPARRDSSASSSSHVAFSVLDEDGAVHQAELVVPDSPTGRPTLYCDLWAADSSGLVGTPRDVEVSVKGAPDELEDAVGGDVKGLERAISTWAAEHAPSAEHATWDEVAESDFSSGTVRLRFTLDDEAKTEVVVTYEDETGEFEVMADA